MNKLFHIICHFKIIHKIILNKATEVQSLKRLSHSKIKVNFSGAHIFLNIAIIATGSVADIIAQKSRVINICI
jgi:hypothetical protein